MCPKEEYKLRDLDELFLKTLERELLLRPLSFGKPLIAIVSGVKDHQSFSRDQLDSCRLEVIGGNHRQEAIQNILQDEENSSKDEYMYVGVQLFLGRLCIMHTFSFAVF